MLVSWAVVNLPFETQLGSCWYHTQLWPRSSWPFVLARLAIASPWVNVKVPCDGSVASYPAYRIKIINTKGFLLHTHFILLAGVIWPNMPELARIVVYWLVERSPLSTAVPKYFLPAALAALLSGVVDVPVGSPPELPLPPELPPELPPPPVEPPPEEP
jgi:hypothetical protein